MHFSSFFEIYFNRVFENIKNNLSTHMQCETVFQLAPHRRIVHLQWDWPKVSLNHNRTGLPRIYNLILWSFWNKNKSSMAHNFIALKRVKGLWIEAFTQQKWPEKVYCNPRGGGGGTPYIRMIEMIVVFLGVKIFRGSSSESIKRTKPVFVRL